MKCKHFLECSLCYLSAIHRPLFKRHSDASSLSCHLLLHQEKKRVPTVGLGAPFYSKSRGLEIGVHLLPVSYCRNDAQSDDFITHLLQVLV